VLAGPWQMGKVDQGVFTHWVLSHYFDRPLRYMGYGGIGKQVRDLLHISDLVTLVEDQLARPEHWDGVTANVGGGPEVSLSLRETTAVCQELTGRKPAIESSVETRPGDVRIYVSDCTRLATHTDWRPTHGPRRILEDIFDWVHENEREVRSALG
jgi:CDP-paratose 2-epimerase